VIVEGKGQFWEVNLGSVCNHGTLLRSCARATCCSEITSGFLVESLPEIHNKWNKRSSSLSERQTGELAVTEYLVVRPLINVDNGDARPTSVNNVLY